MTGNNADRMLPRLAELHVLEPDRVRAESMRTRCREAFARRERRTGRLARRRVGARLVESALVATVSGAYLFGIIQVAFQLLAAR